MRQKYLLALVSVVFLLPGLSLAGEPQKPVKDRSPFEAFGYLDPNPVLSKQRWYILDQQARKELVDGKLALAEKHWKEAVKISESSSQIEPGFINSLAGLSLLYHKKGNVGESERVYEYAMRNLEGFVGRNSMKFATYLPDLAWLYHDHGRHQQAEILFKQHLKMHEGKHGQYSPEILDSLDHYSQFLRSRGRGSEASILEGRARDINYKKNK